MLDPTNPWPTLQAMATALVVAIVVFLVPLGKRGQAQRGTLSVGLGFYAGIVLLLFSGLRLHFPPADDRDRLLLVLFPATIGTELLASALWRSAWSWSLRVLIAAGAAPILLYGSVYLTQAPGPNSLGWTPMEKWVYLRDLAVALIVVWLALDWLTKTAPGRSVTIALAVACAGASVTVMLSGYASGPAGLLLAAALMGAPHGSLFRPSGAMRGAVSLGVVGLFAIVVGGRFFGELTSTNAALLFLAPLLCWLTELPFVPRSRPRLIGIVRVLLTAIPVMMALMLAAGLMRSGADKEAPQAEESVEDYLNFGK